MKIKVLVELFVAWFKIGLFTFGGGYAMLPLIEKEVIDRRGWATNEEILDIFALAQSVPGALAVNSAAFFGRRLAGILGAIVAVTGVIVPSLIVIIIIAMYFMTLQQNPTAMSAFMGVRGAVAGLIGAAAVRVVIASCRNKVAIIIALIALVLNLFTDINVAIIILAGAIAGLVIYYYLPSKKATEHGEDLS